MGQQRYKQLRLEQLRAFCECVRLQSFSAAARALNVSQPTVWQQMHALERDFGVSLLQRRGRLLTPSEDGWVLYELAGSVVASIDSLKDAFEEKRSTVRRTLVVAGSHGIFAEECAEAMVRFCQQSPQVLVTLLLSYPSRQNLEALVEGDADVAIFPFGELEASHPHVTMEPLCVRKPVLITPEGHPLNKKRRPSLREIARYPLIMGNVDADWRRHLEDMFRSAGLLDRLRINVQVSNSLIARRYVALGLGVAIIPLSKNGLFLPNLCIRPLDDRFPEQRVCVFWRRGATPRPQARQFIEMCRQSSE